MKRLLSKLLLGAVAASLGVPSGFAKIYPDDFLIPVQQPMTEQPMPMQPPASSGQPFFFASEIPNGKLTRAQFVDAIATRLYTADEHDSCFADLILSNDVNYNLLFTDVSLNATYATSICLGIRNGFVQGYSDGSFRPDKPITVAEAAAILGDIGGTPLRDSNHMQRGEAWYARYMDAMRSVDREFTMRPWDMMTGPELRHAMCVLKGSTAELDPLGEFTGC